MYPSWSYLDGDAVPTLPDLIQRAADAHEDREFLVSADERVSFAEVERESARWAKGLLALGVGKATRVGVLMPNCPQWVTAFFAVARTGAVTVTLSTFFQAPEISWGVRHVDIDTLLVSARYLNNDYIERLERALPGLAGQTSTELFLPDHPYLRRIVVFGDCDRPWALKGEAALDAALAVRPAIDDAFLKTVEANIAPADLLVTVCTSGTTAEPKAVAHTHGTALRTVEKFLQYIDLRPDDRAYTGQSFFWIGGLNTNILPSLFVGSCLAFSKTPKPADIVEVIQSEKLTILAGWPAQVAGVLEEAGKQGVALDTLRRGAGHVRDELGYEIPPERRQASWLGMTESFGMHSIERSATPVPAGKAGSWGRPLPGTERKVIDLETGEELGPGKKGELYVRTPSLMVGYYKKEREDIFTRDGFFATGDLVSIDEDDYLYFHGRSTEMIKTSGANVSPREVEVAMQTLPGVREATVFGRPHAVKGEMVVAVVVPVEGHTLAPETLRAGLRELVSPYKVPEEFVVMAFDEVPRTGSQKARKPELLKMLLDRDRA